MPAKSTPALSQVATHVLWRVAFFCTVTYTVLLVTSLVILGRQGWPAWVVQALVAGLLAFGWYSSAWQILRVIRRQRGGVPDAEPVAAPDPAK